MRAILFAAAASAFATQVQAEDAAVDEVVVTARAGSEARRKVEAAYAITTVDQEKLRLQSPPSVAEALKNVPGFWVESSGGVGGANIRARGIPIEGFAAVAIQEDGLPVQHDGGLGFLNTDFSFRLDETISRLEVVRGGPSSIFTSYAPGGVVNFISRQPTGPLQGSLKAEGGLRDYGRVDGWLGAKIGGFRISAGGFYRQNDGVRDPGWTAEKGGQFRASVGYDFEGGAAVDFGVKRLDDKTIFYLPVPLTFDAQGNIAEVPRFDARYGTLAGPDTAHLTLRTRNGPFDFDQTRGSDVEIMQYTARVKLDFAGWQVTNGLRYHDTDFTRAALFPNSPVQGTARIAQDLARLPAGSGVVQGRLTYLDGTPFDPVIGNGTGQVMDAFVRQQDIKLEELINDLRFQRTFEFGGQSHDVALGVYYADVDETFRQQGAAVLIDIQENALLLNLVAVNATGQTVATFTENGVSRYGSQFNNAEGGSKTWAVYASDEWRLNDQWRIDVGLRWERIELSGRNEGSATINLGQSPTLADDQAIQGNGVFTPLDRTFDDWAGTVAVNYQMRPDVGFFARYTNAFRLPSLGDFITSPTRTDPRSGRFDLAEGGVKVELPKVTVYATAFYTHFDSQGLTETRFDQATNSFVSRTEFAATQAYGVEFEGQFRPVHWFDVGFNVTLQDPTLKDFVFNERVARVGGVCPGINDVPAAATGDCLRPRDFSGNQQIRIPRVAGRFTPGLNLLDDRLRIEGELQYYGRRFSDTANSLIIPDYFLLNARVRYRVSDQIALYLQGMNLTNEIGLTEGNPRAGQFISGETGARYYLARPEFGRAVRAAVLFSF